jgi:hypothetical protein
LLETGVGVGATATIGPSVGAADAMGSPDGLGGGAMDGSIDGARGDGGGSEGLPAVPPGVGETAGEAGMTRDGDGAGVAPITAMS